MFMSPKRIASAVALGAFAVSSAAHASGYFVYEVSPSGTAQAGANIAAGDEPATIFYNPAGLTRLEGVQAQVSVTGYMPRGRYTSPEGQTTRTDLSLIPAPSLFASWKPVRWMAVGIGGYSAYGLGLAWPDKWAGNTLVQAAKVTSYTVQPSIAFEPIRGVSIGAGLDVVFGALDLSRGVKIGDETGMVRLGGQTTGIGGNVGVMFDPTSWLRLGAHYRTAIKLQVDHGHASFDVPPALQKMLVNQGVSVGITTPHIFGIGARFKPLPQWQIELDGLYIGWSSFDKLAFKFDNPLLSKSEARNWKNSFQVRLGTEYNFEKAAVRGGFLFDQNPIPDASLDPLLPDSNRLGFSLGGAYKWKKWLQPEASYMFVYGLPRTVDAATNKFPGTYGAYAHVISVGVTSRF